MFHLPTNVYLVEASVEDPLDLLAVEHHPLDLAALVFVVEGNGFPGGCTHNKDFTNPRGCFDLVFPSRRSRLMVTPISGLWSLLDTCQMSKASAGESGSRRNMRMMV